MVFNVWPLALQKLFRNATSTSRRRRSTKRWYTPISTIEAVELRVLLAAPTATDGGVGMHVNSFGMANVTVADSDGDMLTVSVETNVTNGVLSMGTDGSFAYTPNANFVGTDSFTFKANDGVENSNIATFSLAVSNVAPTATNGSLGLHANSMGMGGVVVSDSDADTLTVSVETNVTNGVLSMGSDGSFTYTPTANFVGTDSFTFKANDGVADSNVASFTLTVSNAAPIATNGSATIHMNSMLFSNLAVADSDMDTLTVSLVGPTTSNGSLTLNSDGSFNYIPNANWIGTDSFSFKASDGIIDSNTGTYTITVTNASPSAQPDLGPYIVINDGILSVSSSVLSNDSDLDGDLLSAVLYSGASYGTVSLSADGSFFYTPTSDYVGNDLFYYRAFDGLAYSSPVGVTVGRNKVFLENLVPKDPADPTTPPFDPGDDGSFNKSPVDDATVSELWVGELVTLSVNAAGQNTPPTGYSWTIPGDPVEDIVLGPMHPTFGLPTNVTIVPLSAVWYTNDSVQFNWLTGGVYVVSVQVALQGGAGVNLSTQYNVKTPLLSVLYDTGEILTTTLLGVTRVSAGDAHPGTVDPPGISIDVSVVDGPSGSVGFVQIVSNNTYAEFNGDPNAGVPLANPSVGPGAYGIYVAGLDAMVGGTHFDDSPGFPIPVSGAGPTAFVNHSATFYNHITFTSSRPGSIAAANRLVTWSWSFSMNSVADGAAWKWGDPIGSIEASVSSDSGFPTWTTVGKIAGAPWAPTM